MAALNPNLERLTLHMCGQMDSPVFVDWARSFKHLTRLELHAPYLIREPAWLTFLRARGPQLTGFLITNAPRFTQDCLNALIETAVNLKELRLSEFIEMKDSWLEGIAQFTGLTSLDLSSDRSGRISLTSQAVVELLKAVGQNLTLLNLDGNEELDDTVLTEGIALYCAVLENLSLSLLPLLTDEGVAALFTALPRTNELASLNFSRCHEAGSLALRAMLKHSKDTLQSLNINGCKETDEDALSLIGQAAPKLTDLDVGWCRNVNDLVMGSFLRPKRGTTNLKTINCFGCNRITQNCPKMVRLHHIFCRGRN
jgi:DNA repair protein RAD7